MRRIYRSASNKVIAGICGGIGDYFNVDPVILRVVWALSVLALGAGLLLYLICWILIPVAR
ncbi:MAG: PspC domain-containing protein [Bacteroidales bacterium]|jgi:phage shock protein C